ncbi:MAG: ABC transporter substrate-binding protein [Desulfobacteraceae bacterium]|nr:ABC transporter substrate-binding protein [Desulfobacteraceae bacterium]
MSPELLYGKSFGKNRGLAISDEFDQAVKEGKISVVEISSNLVDLAMSNRFELFVDNLLLTQYQLKKKKLIGQIIPLPQPVTKARGAYLIISKAAAIKDKEIIVKRMTKILREIHSDGTIQKIQDKYLK